VRWCELIPEQVLNANLSPAGVEVSPHTYLRVFLIA
jgi:hypothetical protein